MRGLAAAAAFQGFALVSIVYTAALYPPALCGWYLVWPLLGRGPLWLLAGVCLLAVDLLVLLVTAILCSGAAARVLSLRYSGDHALEPPDKQVKKWLLSQMLYMPTAVVLDLFHLYPLKSLHIKLFGGRVGKGAVMGGLITDPALVEVGDHSVVGGFSTILSHAVERGRIRFQPVRIGRDCTVGARATILPGAVLEDGATLGAQSLLPKGAIVPAGKAYGGVPAREIPPGPEGDSQALSGLRGNALTPFKEPAMKIPPSGMTREALFATLESYRANDVKWRSGRVWGYVYDAGREVEEVCKQAYAMFLAENALDPTVYPSLLRLENEVIALCAEHLGGDDQTVGSFTSGGTESILLAVKAARDHCRATRPEIREPEIILPVTAHAAFHKAAHYLGIKAVPAPVHPQTFKADIEAVEQAVTPNTILLVGSAPSYAHGAIDPISQLGELALRRHLPLHVDACIGGFLLPYFRRLGAPVPDFGFRVPGVTSISMDLHKYAYAAKGASVVLYRSKELRKHQLFTCARWPGYIVANPGVQSSKTGGPLAGAWAVLHFIGDDGYLEIARRLLRATRRIIAGIEQIEGLRVLGRPEMSLVAFTSDTVSVFHIADEMKQRGWYVQVQLSFEGQHESLHLSITPSSVPWVDALLADLRASVEAARTLSSGELAATVQAALTQAPPPGPSEEALSQIMAVAGIQGTELPERMAPINELLNALPPELRESLLVKFSNELYRPSSGSRPGQPTGG